MNEIQKAILYQALGYLVATFIGIGVIALLQRDFFFKYLKVRASLGKKILVKIRAVNRWYYEVGEINEGDLVFGSKKQRKRINNTKDNYFYRSMGIAWVNIDEEKNAILEPNLTGVTGFDAEKQESLLVRALYKPSLDDNKEKIILILLVLAIVAAGISAYFGYNVLNQLEVLKGTLNAIKSGMVVATG